MGTQRYKMQEVLAALKACKGYVYLAAERLGCDGRTVLRYMKRYPKLRESIKHIRGHRLDVGEAALEKAVLAGEAWAVQFLLRTQGKSRGYVDNDQQERQTEVIAATTRMRAALQTSEGRALLLGTLTICESSSTPILNSAPISPAQPISQLPTPMVNGEQPHT